MWSEPLHVWLSFTNTRAVDSAPPAGRVRNYIQHWAQALTVKTSIISPFKIFLHPPYIPYSALLSSLSYNKHLCELSTRTLGLGEAFTTQDMPEGYIGMISAQICYYSKINTLVR